jgi:hypothetical protein
MDLDDYENQLNDIWSIENILKYANNYKASFGHISIKIKTRSKKSQLRIKKKLIASAEQ